MRRDPGFGALVAVLGDWGGRNESGWGDVPERLLGKWRGCASDSPELTSTPPVRAGGPYVGVRPGFGSAAPSVASKSSPRGRRLTHGAQWRERCPS